MPSTLAVKASQLEEVVCAFCRGTGKDPFDIMSSLSNCCVCGGRGKVFAPAPPYSLRALSGQRGDQDFYLHGLPRERRCSCSGRSHHGMPGVPGHGRRRLGPGDGLSDVPRSGMGLCGINNANAKGVKSQ